MSTVVVERNALVAAVGSERDILVHLAWVGCWILSLDGVVLVIGHCQ